MTRTLHAGRPPLPPTAIATLDRAITGAVLAPGDRGYDERRRVWNGSIDRRPAAIVRCADVADVAAAVRFAAARDLLAAVRGGGHSFPGYSTCDDGMVIDLREMRGVDVGLDAGTVRVGAGALLGELDAATLPHGVGVPAGIVSHTGVAGLTLGGGLGWQQRRHGLSIDNLVAADVVLADGSRVTASDDAHADLFWGLRGGGGNFGIVTSFTFRLNPVGPQVMAGPVFWAAEDTPEVLRFFRSWIHDAPEALTTIVVQRRLPALHTVPRDLVGRDVIAVVACHIGPVDEGRQALAPLKRFGRPLLDLCEPKPFLTHQRMFDQSYPAGWCYSVRACDVAELSDDVIDIVAAHGPRMTSSISSVAVWQMGGAVARVGDDETAFRGRQAGFSFNINGNTRTPEGFARERAWARTYWSALAPHHTSVYVNFLMDEGEDRIRQAYGDAKYDRLRALKRRYDPTNRFRLNQNIPPN